ncbi:helix-hairpin-helix domain-containing protein [Paenarthrobacter sp. Z7-10]|uniref:helix-hairpin-helix domain-containing protein n=1 Tax=Paenarthrobacter sp. Z7-10 TaxID=2787635 RepID=UPI0022A8DB8A|nr:helix-hairpin-helix domain-containing protein [Paenarthrobacter sp. Z7-10]MCZ2402698.1 helix-hairpin-helix domain-containing protein [Paenarthrobacter sp. Z7-10]
MARESRQRGAPGVDGHPSRLAELLQPPGRTGVRPPGRHAGTGLSRSPTVGLLPALQNGRPATVGPGATSGSAVVHGEDAAEHNRATADTAETPDTVETGDNTSATAPADGLTPSRYIAQTGATAGAVTPAGGTAPAQVSAPPGGTAVEDDSGRDRSPGAGDDPPKRRTIRWRVASGAVIVALAMLLSAVAVLWLQAASQRFPVQSVAAVVSPKVTVPPLETNSVPSPAATKPAESPAPSTTAGTFVVYIAGAVKRPGIFSLPAGSRLYQAIDRAGGSLPEAALEAVNLAAPLQDGEQVIVPTRDQVAAQLIPAAAAPGSGPQAATQQPGSGGGSAAKILPVPGTAGAKINLNTSTAEELQTLPRVGPVLAQRIVQWRLDHGRFSSAQELDSVDGVGPKMLESLLPLVTI